MADHRAAALRDSVPASQEEATKVVGTLNRKAAALYLEARSQSDLYFAIFRRVDSNRRGCISFVRTKSTCPEQITVASIT